MARFDVYKAENVSPLLVEVQSNVLSDLSTRVVVPLLPVNQTSPERLSRLHPVIRIENKDYVLRVTELGCVSKDILKKPICNIETEYRDEITNALDFLFQGF